MKDNKTLAWLWKLAGKQKRNILFLMMSHVIVSLASAFMAWFFRGLIDQAVAGNRSGFIRYCIALVTTVVVILAMNALIRYLLELTRSTLENIFKGRLYTQILLRGYSDVRQIHAGEWMNRLTSDTVVVANGISSILPEIAGLITKLISALVILIIMLPELAWLIVPGGVILIIVTYIFRKKLKLLHKRIQEADGKLRVYLSEHISNLLIVRSFGQEYRSKEQAEQLMREHKKFRMRRNMFMNLCNIGFGIIMRGVYIAGAIYCGFGILNGTISYGTFVAVIQLISQVQSPFASISGYIPQYYAMLASAERLMEIEEFEMDVMPEKKSCFDFETIGFSDVSFSYNKRDGEYSHAENGSDPCDDERKVLKNMSFEIHRGENVAITGISGCGKSTILKLLMCLYPVDGGERYIIERNPQNADENDELLQKRTLLPQDRSLFAYVPQGNQLMSGTIREVLTFGEAKDDSVDARLWAALDIACMKELVEKTEAGLDTVLGENGYGLSEGQMQRIAIARAIVSGHPILLLDEATSALDEATERQLLSNLKNLTEMTVIIVTHRKAVLSICNKEIALS